MGNSLLDVIVFGRNAGKKAAAKAKEVELGAMNLDHVASYDESPQKKCHRSFCRSMQGMRDRFVCAVDFAQEQQFRRAFIFARVFLLREGEPELFAYWKWMKFYKEIRLCVR